MTGPPRCHALAPRLRAAALAALPALVLVSAPTPAASWNGEAVETLQTPEPARGAAPEGQPAFDLTLRRGGSRRDIPWDGLGEADYVMVREVVAGAAVSREVPDIAFRSRKPVFDFLIEHLDFAADVARTLRQGKYRVRRAGDGYEAEDGRGARGTLRPVFADGGRRVFYLAGRYDVPLVPTLDVRGVVQLEAEHVEGADGTTYCALRVAGHVRFESRLIETLAWVSRNYGEAQLDRQIRRFFGHVAVVSRRAYDDPEGLADELSRRPDLPAQRVAEFREVLVGHLPPPWSETQRYQLVEPLAPPPPRD